MLKIGLIFILIGPIILGFPKAFGEDWKFLQRNARGEFFYDAENMNRPSADIIGVWLKVIYSEKFKEQEGFGNLSQAIGFWEINCAEKKARLLSISHYSKEVELIHPYPRVPLTPDWESMAPDTVLDGLRIQVCK